MNLYGVDSSTYGISVLLIDYIVPSDHSYKLSSLIGWGDTPAEYEVFINDIPIAGGRSSDQYRTIQVWWENSLIANPGDTITVLATHYSQGYLAMKCNLILNRV